MKVTKFLTKKKWAAPYTEADLKDAIKFGRQLALEEIKASMVGMVVNGTVKNVLTEEKLTELMKCQ